MKTYLSKTPVWMEATKEIMDLHGKGLVVNDCGKVYEVTINVTPHAADDKRASVELRNNYSVEVHAGDTARGILSTDGCRHSSEFLTSYTLGLIRPHTLPSPQHVELLLVLPSGPEH